MSDIDVDWHGLNEMIVKLNKIPLSTQHTISSVVKNNTEELKANAKSLAPVDTGFLKENIKSSYPNELEGRVAGEAAYAGYQEYGTRYQLGKPHIRPAYNKQKQKFVREVEKAMKGMFK